MVLQNAVKNISGKWLGLLILLILFIFQNYNEEALFFAENRNKVISLKEEVLREEFPGMETHGETAELKGWSRVLNSSGESLGYYTVADRNRWSYSGYGGGVPLLVKLSKDKKITEIRLLENSETRRFLLKLYQREFLKSWNGQTLSEAADSRVDAISGVTLTSNTIIANLSEILEKTENRSPMGKVNYRQLIIRIAELTLFIFGLFSFFVRDLRKFRYGYLAAIILVFGFTAGDFISMAMMRGFLTGSVSFFGNPILWILFVSSILVPLVTNKAFYCHYLCPFGAAQELIGQFSPEKKRLSGSLKKFFKYSRPVLFGVIAVSIILDYKMDLSLVEPFASFLYSVAAPFTLFLALISLVLSIFFSKPWCKWFCPTGQLLEYFRSKD